MSAEADAQLRNTIKDWQNALIDPSRRNKLLNFKTAKSTLEIDAPGPGQLLRKLEHGWVFSHTDEEQSVLPEGCARTTKNTAAELRNALRNLDRKATEFELDRGLWVLYLAVGMLHWRGVDDYEYDSPLLLFPVRLERGTPDAPYRLRRHGGEEPTSNQSLQLRLQDLGFEKLPVPDFDGLDVDDYLTQTTAAIAGQPGWTVQPRAVLSLFSFSKEVMYADLQQNTEAILRNPLVRTLGLSAHVETGFDLGFEPVAEDQLDQAAPPETTPLVIDADSSQRKCVKAAVDGRSFVMNGPPGTGKTQTIANIIAALMHAGKSVLFVSEKAAALDVAYERLASEGLGHYVLKLNSHSATRKAVARQLGEALTYAVAAPTGLDAIERDRLRALREELSAYADAMNEVRAPLGQTLHRVIGELAAVRDGFAVRYEGPDIRQLTRREVHRVREAADRAARSWRVVEEGDDFAWRGVVRPVGHETLLAEAGHRAAEIRNLIARHDDLASPLGIAEVVDLPRLIGVLGLAAERRPVPLAWLTEPDFAAIASAAHEVADNAARVRASVAAAQESAGLSWKSLRKTAEITSFTPQTLGVRPADLSNAPAEVIRGAADCLEQRSALAARLQTEGASLAARFGAPPPLDASAIADLVELASFAGNPHRPEASWLTEHGLADATRAARELAQLASELERLRRATLEVFNAEVADATELSAVAARLDGYGAASKLGLSSQYRRDKAYLAALTNAGSVSRGVLDALPRALELQRAIVHFERAATVSGPILGTCFAGEATDFALIESLLKDADTIRLLARAADPSRIRSILTADAHPDPTVVGASSRLRQLAEEWRDAPDDTDVAAAWPYVALLPLEHATAWCDLQVPRLRAEQTMAEGVSQSLGRSVTYGEARAALDLVSAAFDAMERFAAGEEAARRLLGRLYAGEQTDRVNVEDALVWTRRVRRTAWSDLDRPLPERAARHVMTTEPDHNAPRALTDWSSALTDVVELFDDDHRDKIRRGLSQSLEAAERRFGALLGDLGGVDLWRDFIEACEELRGLGLRAAIDRFVAEARPVELLRATCERTLLQAWVDDIMISDARLRRSTAAERDARVAQFAALDARAATSARSAVMHEVDARKRFGEAGAAGRIKYEAQKKTRHIPVRKLIADNFEVVRQIKPCFMMSPITVSQFVDPRIAFDTVIFDEASQVEPADAVNAVYRGRQLIVAGDQKQLPPTSFFAAVDADSGDGSEDYDETSSTARDFPSLLDRCVATRFTQLPLRWHYRSQHESLIAYSNRMFYNSDLVTFPTPFEDVPDFGVKFFKVDGVYRRGSKRDNPIEAEAVAQRVLHHFRTRPGKTIGIVTLSTAQAGTIEDALERLRLQHPDLEPYFVQDRTKGLFVKSIESVQGDERDVIIFSVGYGRDEHGVLRMTFGPLNLEGGERRLNVAVTRARQCVEVVSSIHGREIDSGASAARRHFKQYLEYAEHGIAAFAQPETDTAGAPESPFEESVIDFLRSAGIEAVPQVGVAGYRIDLGIPHPDAKGVYVLGIECDGVMYHSAKTARDRDRLREQVLNGMGWNLHRIWGTAWYRDRAAAEEQLLAAVQAAIRAYDEKAAVPPPPITPPNFPSHDARSVDEAALIELVSTTQSRSWTVDYVVSAPRRISSPYALHEAGARPTIRSIVLTVLEVEAPIHREVLLTRVREAWGVARAGNPIRANFSAALSDLHFSGKIIADEEFVDRPGRFTAPVRVPNGTMPRKVGHVPPAERRLALYKLAEESPGMNREELLTEVSRLFGWQRVGTDISAALYADIKALLAAQELEEKDGQLFRR